MVKRGVEWVIVDQGRVEQVIVERGMVEQVRIAQVKRVRRTARDGPRKPAQQPCTATAG